MYALLKVRGVRVNLGNNEDCAPLQYAAVKGDPEVVRWLVRKGSKVRGDGTPSYGSEERQGTGGGIPVKTTFVANSFAYMNNTCIYTYVYILYMV